jgi:hypothetical protein
MHDPLCFEFDNKGDDCFDHSLASPFCYCDLISKVRADERMVIYADHLVHDYERTGEAWEMGYKMGREHERENCIKIVQSVGGKTHYWHATWANWRNETLRLLGYAQ